MRLTGVVALAVAACVSAPAAQWPNRMSPRVPQTNGRADLAAPAPRTADGRPDLSGVWEAMPDPTGKPGGIEGVVPPRYLQDVTRDVPAAGAPLMLPWAEALYKARAANEFLDNPQIRCLPSGVPRAHALIMPHKIVQAPDLVIVLYERGTLYRQIFLDGRRHPADPQPAWMGYSIGRWEGDTLVVETVGFTDQTWLDGTGHPHSARMRLIERFTRRSVGRMDVDITIDDPDTYTRPIRYVQPQVLLPDGELIEYVCSENLKPVRR